MGAETGISWCDRTWSPWIGCTKVSPACDGCYAAHLMDTRLGRVEWGPHGERRRTSESYWRQIAKWNREAEKAGRIISVFPSLCDPWDNAADPGIRREWFAVMRETPHLLHLLLSKRPQNAAPMAEAAGGLPSNAALGATCEDQKRADINVPHLLLAKRQLGARLAFLSCEPLLGTIDLANISTMRFCGAEVLNGLTGELRGMFGDPCGTRLPGLDWIITGGETDQGSHKARPTHPAWFRQIRDACAAAGVPYHHKQNGEWHTGSVLMTTGQPVFREFRTFQHWVDKAQTWVRGGACLDAQGRQLHRGADFMRARDEEAFPVTIMDRVGKKAAGRLLDGVLHDAMPGTRAP